MKQAATTTTSTGTTTTLIIKNNTPNGSTATTKGNGNSGCLLYQPTCFSRAKCQVSHTIVDGQWWLDGQRVSEELTQITLQTLQPQPANDSSKLGLSHRLPPPNKTISRRRTGAYDGRHSSDTSWVLLPPILSLGIKSCVALGPAVACTAVVEQMKENFSSAPGRHPGRHSKGIPDWSRQVLSFMRCSAESHHPSGEKIGRRREIRHEESGHPNCSDSDTRFACMPRS